jgi:ABC-type uncharacterized transport system substrate-binding protein
MGHKLSPFRINWCRSFLMTVFVSLYLIALVCSVIAQDTPHVIILNSYHRGFTWSDGEESGFLERLREAYPEIDVPIEYLDAKRNPEFQNYERFKGFLIDKYNGKQVDLIAVFDNPALEMLVRYREELFPGIPVVFAGISDFEQSVMAGRERMTGVAEIKDFENTLEMMLAIHPETREILILNDFTSSGISARREMEQAV